jgi:hypothetical protein
MNSSARVSRMEIGLRMILSVQVSIAYTDKGLQDVGEE